MELKKCTKESFAVIGKEGSTDSGEGFIQRLWEDANSHFNEVQHLAKKDDEGNIVGIWGAMSDFSRSFMPWEDGFTRGLYLAGVECDVAAEAPEGWTKWVIPGYEYIYAESEEDTFPKVIRYLQDNGMELAGAVHDFTCPKTGNGYMFFPVKRI
ncbi:MAG: GyrI-like domain-containing protein [Oscillospiraceae bacterium]|nr:GyrI-like domain-containing protein [Oscillospiraceae bacterium]